MKMTRSVYVDCMIPNGPGTYVLLVALPRNRNLEIGRSGTADLEPGLYCYVGSALGPGGLAARLRRHASSPERKHWHIDYLLPHARLLGAMALAGRQRLECRWASWLEEIGGMCVSRFGASDCRCRGRLFHFGTFSTEHALVDLVRKDLGARFIHPDDLKPGANRS